MKIQKKTVESIDSKLKSIATSENKITFVVEESDENGLYKLSYMYRELGAVVDECINSTPEFIMVDALECIADHLKSMVDQKRYELVLAHNENTPKKKVRDLSQYRNVCDYALSVYDGKKFDLCIDGVDGAYSEVLDILEMDKVSVSELQVYTREGHSYHDIDGDSSVLLCELIENRVDMYIDISLDDKPGYLHVWLKKDAIITVEEFTIEMLP